jgi:hypothetical protein
MPLIAILRASVLELPGKYRIIQERQKNGCFKNSIKRPF